MNMFEKLAEPFPLDAVHWRAQSVAKEGDKARALAYIDARDVQDRLDAVCTPAGWRNSVVETPKGRVICTIEIKIGDEWIGKTDGAGDTDVEGEKGALSDALKRAAVLWGIGRYLYALKSPWVPCESYEKNGKRHWRKWTANPWDFVRGAPRPDPVTSDAPTGPINDKTRDWLAAQITGAGTTVQNLCDRFEVKSLKEIQYEQIGDVRQWLAEQKEAA